MLIRNKKADVKAAQGIALDVMKEWEAEGKTWTAREVADEVGRRESYYSVYHGEISKFVHDHPLSL